MKTVTTTNGEKFSYPDKFTADEIKADMDARFAKGATADSAGAAVASHGASGGFGPLDMLKARALEALPSAGGFVGGMVGSLGGYPGAVAGAGAGGSLGEGTRELFSGRPLSGADIGKQGVEQAAFEAAGGLLAKGAMKAAGPLMQKSLGVVSSLAKRFRTTPEAIAQIVLKSRFPVSMAGEGSAQNMANVVRAARNAAIKAAPGNVTARELATVAIRDAERSVGRPLTTAERRSLISTVQDEADAILTRMTHGAVPKSLPGTPPQPASKLLSQLGEPAIPARAAVPPPKSTYIPFEVEQIKEAAAKRARPAYRAEQAAMGVAADPALSKQIASGARKRLNLIPGVKGQNVEIKNLMAAQQAINEAMAKSSGEWTPLHVGPVSVGFKLSRKRMGDLALLLTHPRFQAIARQSPRAVAAIVAQLVHTDEPDRTAANDEAMRRILGP